MKKIVLIAGFAFAMASCKNNDVAEAQQRTIDSMKIEMARQQVIDSMNQAMAEAEAVRRDSVLNAEKTAAAVAPRSRTRSSRSSGGGSNVTNNYYTTTAPANTNVQQQPAQKKRWSSKATGTLVGAGVGALGGALISKEKGKGAIIGGVSGAAVGLGTGAIIDAERKRKERERLEQQQQQQR